MAEMRQAPEDKMRNALFGSHQRASNNDVPPLGGNRPDVRPPQKHHPLDPTLYGRFSHHLLYKGSFWAAIPRSAATGRRSDVWERDYSGGVTNVKFYVQASVKVIGRTCLQIGARQFQVFGVQLEVLGVASL